MFGFFATVRRDAADPLTDVAVAEAFGRALPQDDPIAAQVAICGVLADLVVRGTPRISRLHALLALDRRARTLVDRLVAHGVGGGPPSPAQEAQSRQAAFELCRSLGRVHTQFLESMRDGARSPDRSDVVPYLILGLFQHRQMELALRPFVDERSTRFAWAGVHKAYRFAQSRRLERDRLPVNRDHSASALDTTLEREYIHVLLADLMNSGHFPPRDAIWITRSLPRWSESLVLRERPDGSAATCFVADPESDSGLVRSGPDSPGASLCLDLAPAVASIRAEIASLRDTTSLPSEGSPLPPGRQIKLLRRLNDVCAPERPVIARRGERKPLALTVEVALGLPQILRTLRGHREGEAAAMAPTIALGDGATVTGFGDSGSTIGNGASTVTQASFPAVATAHPTMAMVDRSESGCRLLGPTVASNPIMPGGLIAIRDDATTPWSLAVVRRVKKRLAGKRVEIGVEYLGRNPRWVIVVSDGDAGPADPSVPPGAASQRFAALYLPESASHPVLPMNTLVLPARGLRPEDRLSIRSRTSIHTIQLKEPLDEQAEFIWSPFEILDRWLRNEPAPGKRSQERAESQA